MSEQDHEFYGVHVFGEMYGIEPHLLDDAKLLEEALREGIKRSHATILNFHTSKFEPAGLTMLVCLSESHASIHTYPDRKALFFDAFTCGRTCQPETIEQALKEAIKPAYWYTKKMLRGDALKIPELESLKNLS